MHGDDCGPVRARVCCAPFTLLRLLTLHCTRRRGVAEGEGAQQTEKGAADAKEYRGRPGSACVMRARRDAVHPASCRANSARRNPPELDSCEPTSHNASPDDIAKTTPPGRRGGAHRAERNLHHPRRRLPRGGGAQADSASSPGPRPPTPLRRNAPRPPRDPPPTMILWNAIRGRGGRWNRGGRRGRQGSRRSPARTSSTASTRRPPAACAPASTSTRSAPTTTTGTRPWSCSSSSPAPWSCARRGASTSSSRATSSSSTPTTATPR